MKQAVALRQMSAADFDAYAARAIALLAEAQACAYGGTVQACLASADAAFRKVRPDAEPAASGQHLYVVVDAAGEPLGVVWFELRQAALDPYVYLYDWVIWPEHRGKGFGKAAMDLVEQRAQEYGARRIMLNVFSQNRFAFELYRRYGFEVGSTILVKRIDASWS